MVEACGILSNLLFHLIQPNHTYPQALAWPCLSWVSYGPLPFASPDLSISKQFPSPGAWYISRVGDVWSSSHKAHQRRQAQPGILGRLRQLLP